MSLVLTGRAVWSYGGGGVVRLDCGQCSSGERTPGLSLNAVLLSYRAYAAY